MIFKSLSLHISKWFSTIMNLPWFYKRKVSIVLNTMLLYCRSIPDIISNPSLLLLLLLSRFSRVRLCATPQTAAHQAPPSLAFSRQEHWSGLPFPSPMHESEKWKWSKQLCPSLSDPMDCSLPGSSIHGIYQARVLEWVAISFSDPSLQMATTLSFCMWKTVN